MLKFNKPAFNELQNKEWLITNGIGGYASGSLSGANTRRYHGLLVASLQPPTQRQVMVAKTEESIYVKRDTCIELSANQYANHVSPSGTQYLKEFSRSPFPKFVYEVDGHILSKTIFMIQDSNTCIVEYENIGNSSFALKVTPFFTYRDYHGLAHEKAENDFYYEKRGESLTIYAHYGATPLYFKSYNGTFEESRFWIKGLEYEKERYRGLDFQEDNYVLGRVSMQLSAGEKSWLVFSLDEDRMMIEPAQKKKEALAYLKKIQPENTKNTFYKDLVIAGNQFIVKRKSTESYTILAGYHWFTDWGRDTMIAIRGLSIAIGNKEVSRSILQTFISYLDQGMLPNRFPDYEGEEAEYNTVDATLWLFIALYEHYQKFQDETFLKKVFPHLSDIIQAHFEGTRYKIGITKEGFLFAGEDKVQLTWMDAKVGDFVVTPRHGCPVEIQALWYNALKIYQFFSNEFGIKNNKILRTTCEAIITKLPKHFEKHFYNEGHYLNDVVVPDVSVDSSIRPNQIYAISLPFSLLSTTLEKKVFNTIKDQLYTPYGLKTLNEEHPDFKPIYKGNQWDRDTAYHQGTIWPFLLGDYYSALLKVNKFSLKSRKEVLQSMEVLKSHFYEEDCIHGISEIFDGKNPNEGRGTVQQAWSISGLLKVFIEGELEEL